MAPKFAEHTFSGSFIYYATAFSLSTGITRTISRGLWLARYRDRIIPDDVGLDRSTFYGRNTFKPGILVSCGRCQKCHKYGGLLRIMGSGLLKHLKGMHRNASQTKIIVRCRSHAVLGR